MLCYCQAFLTCFQDSVKRTAVGIWNCRACRKVIAGGAYALATPAATTVRRLVDFDFIQSALIIEFSTIRRLRDVHAE